MTLKLQNPSFLPQHLVIYTSDQRFNFYTHFSKNHPKSHFYTYTITVAFRYQESSTFTLKNLYTPPLKPPRNPHKLIKEAPHHPIPTIFTFSITKVKPLPHKDTLTIVNVLLKYHTPKNLKHSHFHSFTL